MVIDSNSFIRIIFLYYYRSITNLCPSIIMSEVSIECNKCKKDCDIENIKEITVVKTKKEETMRVCLSCLEFFKTKAKKHKIDLIIHGSMKKDDKNIFAADVIDVHELISENRGLYKVKTLLRAKNLLETTDVIIKYTVIDGRPIDVICPICKTKKQINIPENVINEAKQLTSISISKDIVCTHHFQAFVDKNFVVRGYQKVDYHIDEALKEIEEAMELYRENSKAAVSQQMN